jgi:hypothetical protein
MTVRRAAPYLALALISIRPAFAQQVVANWFPVHIGDRWIYQHETRDDTGRGQADLEIHHWKTEQTIVGSRAVPEGTLLELNVQVMDGSPNRGRRVDPSPAFLIRDNCLYLTYVEWDPASHVLKPEYRAGLSAARYAADFCFPLAVGKTWGAPHWADWRPPADAKDWQVQSASAEPNTFHIKSISSYPGSGETGDIWFKKGIGIVREQDVHHGTIGVIGAQLLRFQPASSR